MIKNLVFLYFIDIFSKYAWVIPLKDKKGITITNAFQTFLKESNHKPNKLWIDKGSEFYNISMKSWLKTLLVMYSTYNKGKYVIPDGFIRNLKNKIYKHMVLI